MILLLDIGNTRIKWARFISDGEGKLEQAELLDVGGDDHAEYTLEQMAALYWSGWPQPKQVIVSTVITNDYWRQLQSWCRQHWQLSPVRVIPVAEGFGMHNAYLSADELGSDRWLAMLAAHHLLHRETCVVDVGTAITLDFLHADGRHLGGYIIPGLQLMEQSLIQGTDAIQLSAGTFSNKTELATGRDINLLPGISTTECIERGLMLAAIGLIKESCKKMQDRMGKPFLCLLTGGHAKLLAPPLGADPALGVQLEPNLVLLGLAQIAGKYYQ
ncbi:MAG TPA: type III pantothenate kinase [Gammaproteobacteria bacterium]|nr:type III pantothenate kinase [Gammaproteobacteria bacterium]